jgi:hypothetical protein
MRTRPPGPTTAARRACSFVINIDDVVALRGVVGSSPVTGEEFIFAATQSRCLPTNFPRKIRH